MKEEPVRWLRFLPRTALEFAVNDDALMVFVGVHGSHYLDFGLAEQSMLTGPGEIDSKLQTFRSVPGSWSVPMALEHCVRHLRDLGSDKSTPIGSSDRLHMFSEIEGLEGRRYGRQQVLLTGLIAQEVILPKGIWQNMVDRTTREPSQFHLLKNVGLHMMESRTLDIQPQGFRDWFVGAMTGSIKSPGKKPKGFAVYQRHRVIQALVGKFSSQGIPPTSSNVPDQVNSACGIVAHAAAAAGLSQPRSYEGVRKIWAKRNSAKGP